MNKVDIEKDKDSTKEENTKKKRLTRKRSFDFKEEENKKQNINKPKKKVKEYETRRRRRNRLKEQNMLQNSSDLEVIDEENNQEEYEQVSNSSLYNRNKNETPVYFNLKDKIGNKNKNRRNTKKQNDENKVNIKAKENDIPNYQNDFNRGIHSFYVLYF